MMSLSRHVALSIALTAMSLDLSSPALAQDPDGGSGRGRPLPAYRPNVPAIHGIVTAGHPLAAMAGLQMLMRGGNAFDAAIAVGTTLNMMEPQMNSIAGNGFMTVFPKKTGKVMSLAMAGAAPLSLRASEMTPESLVWGMQAGLPPGNIGGYLVAFQRFGTMSLKDVLAPAIDYAEHGYPMDRTLAAAITGAQKRLSDFPTTAKIFLPNGAPPAAGELFKNPDLANTLKKLVDAEQTALKHGKSREAAIQAAYDRFYKGDIAEEFDSFFKQHGGLITKADLAAVKPEWEAALHTTYRGYDVYSNPSSSRGGFELEMALNLVEPYDLAKMGNMSPEALHLEMDAIKISKADIYHYVGDSRSEKVPTQELISKRYALERGKLLDQSSRLRIPSGVKFPGTPRPRRPPWSLAKGPCSTMTTRLSATQRASLS